jgi:hypothetical protein
MFSDDKSRSLFRYLLTLDITNASTRFFIEQKWRSLTPPRGHVLTLESNPAKAFLDHYRRFHACPKPDCQANSGEELTRSGCAERP